MSSQHNSISVFVCYQNNVCKSSQPTSSVLENYYPACHAILKQRMLNMYGLFWVLKMIKIMTNMIQCYYYWKKRSTWFWTPPCQMYFIDLCSQSCLWKVKLSCNQGLHIFDSICCEEKFCWRLPFYVSGISKYFPVVVSYHSHINYHPTEVFFYRVNYCCLGYSPSKHKNDKTIDMW